MKKLLVAVIFVATVGSAQAEPTKEDAVVATLQSFLKDNKDTATVALLIGIAYGIGVAVGATLKDD